MKKRMVGTHEVSEQIDCSKACAYNLIRKLSDELAETERLTIPVKVRLITSKLDN